MKKRVVVALGHRALGTTLPEQKTAVKHTAKCIADLIEEGYNVLLVEDCIGSRKENDKVIACRRAEAEGGLLTTYEAVLYELTEGAYSGHFKSISKLTK